MSVLLAPGVTQQGRRRGRGRRARASAVGGNAGYAFVAPYTVLLVVFGLAPALYAIWLAFTNAKGQFVGLGQFIRVAQDYRFVPAFLHIGVYLAFWMFSLVVFVVLIALMLHGRMRRTGVSMRFLYYLPGALAGVSSVLLWLILLSPRSSPIKFILNWFGWERLAQVIAPGNLPILFTIIAFWTGAGGWIVIMHGALNNISLEIIEAAKIDGANVFQLARYIEVPMLRKWIAYMAILAFAAGTQLFVEPSLVSTVSQGVVSSTWSPNQLAYSYAFEAGDFNGAAAISVYLLLVGIVCAAVVVFKSGLFERD